MKRWGTLVGVALLLLSANRAVAIPPPWMIEQWKGEADVIVIAKATKIEAVVGTPTVDSKVGLQVIELLKGELTEQQRASLEMYYSNPAPPPGAFGVQAMAIGGTGYPKVREGEPALVFLKKNARLDHYQAVAGSFGYVDLDAKSADSLAKVQKTIARYQQWTGKIGDEAIRTAMDGYYQKALALAEKQSKENAGSPKPAE